MKTKNKPAAPTPLKKSTTASPQKKSTAAGSLFDKAEKDLAENRRFYSLLIPAIAVIFSFLCFDNKISIANDDALYIEAGANYAKDFFGYFYTGNAPLYPMILGLAVKVFGVNLFFLKCISIVFFATALYLLYRTFEKRIPYIILIPALLLTAINFPYLMYASLTYSECFYLLIIAVSFNILFRAFDKITAETTFSVKLIPSVILIGFGGFLFVVTRNIALVAIVAIVIYLIYRRKYIEAALSSVAFGAFYFIYRFLVQTIWHLDQSQYAGQSKIIFQKNAYNAQMGQETFGGYITRLIDNAQIYIGQRLMYVLGFKPEMAIPTEAGKMAELNAGNMFIVLVFIGIVLLSLYHMYKNKQYSLIFATLFFSVLLGTNFVALQTSWGQTRFIMIYLPLILFTTFYLFYHYGVKNIAVQYVYGFVLFVLLISNLSLTFKNIRQRLPVFVENMQGDPTYGYTPDWQNFIKMSRWVKDNLPNEVVASRKAPMSFIFSGGKEFYGIYNTPAYDADSLLTPLRQNKVDYIMLAELRLDPGRYLENQYINTVHRYAYYILQKYPDAFQFIHREGEYEKAELYKINYAYIDSMKLAKKITP